VLARLGRAVALAGLLALPAAVAGAADAPSPDEGQSLDIRRPSPEQRRRLLAGETIAYQVVEPSDSDLAAGVAVYIAAPLARVADALTSPDVVLKDAGITASGPIPPGAPDTALHGFRLAPGEIGEAQDALDAAPRFNFSAPEAEAFRAARAALRGGERAAVAEAATAQWRALLRRRAQAFQTRGLDGAAPYARRPPPNDPAAILRAAAGDARILAPVAPRLGEALVRFPAEQSPTAVSQIYWMKRQVQGRPVPLLMQHLVDVTPTVAFYVERHFYAGQTYVASQTLCAAVPFEDGVLVLSSSRVSTDQVTGLGGEMKRIIGRRQLRGEIAKRFERIRAGLTRAPAAPPERVESP
jgi:hypothetical protein